MIASLGTDQDVGLTLSHRQPVMALHCSSATGRQWVHLAEASAGPAPLVMPDLLGTPSRGPRQGDGAFSLAEEAEPIVRSLTRLARPVHLVGHSYGGALALHVARRHPGLVASVCVYEPTAFHLLHHGTPVDRRLAADIAALSDILRLAIDAEVPGYAAWLFTDFWGGNGAWAAMPDLQKDRLVAWIAKAPLDFHALLSEPCAPGDLATISVPVTLIAGDASHPHALAVLRMLTGVLPRARRVDLAGAGHLGPITHKARVAELIADHLARAEAR